MAMVKVRVKGQGQCVLSRIKKSILQFSITHIQYVVLLQFAIIKRENLFWGVRWWKIMAMERK